MIHIIPSSLILIFTNLHTSCLFYSTVVIFIILDLHPLVMLSKTNRVIPDGTLFGQVPCVRLLLTYYRLQENSRAADLFLSHSIFYIYVLSWLCCFQVCWNIPIVNNDTNTYSLPCFPNVGLSMAMYQVGFERINGH